MLDGKALASVVINDYTKNHRDLPERWSFHFWSRRANNWELNTTTPQGIKTI